LHVRRRHGVDVVDDVGFGGVDRIDDLLGRELR
jgi:hypothetical protein